ncbi:MAG: hypothetical protein HY547_09920 [Elusimicrobia bacterium]|nr:hypothetical protein [Elusimicrobiota bacterium]
MSKNKLSAKFRGNKSDDFYRVIDLADSEYLPDLSDECEFVVNYRLGRLNPKDFGVRKRLKAIKYSPDKDAGKWARKRLEHYRQRRKRLMSPKSPRAGQIAKEINCVRRFLQNEGQDISYWRIIKHPKQDDDIDVVAHGIGFGDKNILFQIRELDSEYAGQVGKWGLGMTGGRPEDSVKLAYWAIEDKLFKCQTKDLVLLFDWNVRPTDEHIARMERAFRVLKFRKLIKKFLGVYIVCRIRNIKIKSWSQWDLAPV